MKKRILFFLLAITGLMACTIFAQDVPLPLPETAQATETAAPPTASPTEAPPTETALPPTEVPVEPQPRTTIRSENAAMLHEESEIQTSQVWGASISPDGSFAAVLAGTSTLIVDLHSQIILETIAGDALQNIAYAPAADGYAAVTLEGDLILRPPGAAESIRLPNHDDIALDVQYAPDGNTLLSSSLDGTIKIRDAHTGELLHVIPGDTFGSGMTPELIRFSPDGTQAAVFLFDYSTLWVGDSASLLAGAPEGELIPWLEHAGPVASVFISPDWQHLAWISRGTLQIMTIDGEFVGTPRSHEDWITYPGFLASQDAVYLASLTFADGQETGLIRGYSLETSETVFEFKSPGMIVALSRTPDGSRLVSGHTNGSVKVWDPTGTEAPIEIPGHSGAVQNLSFSADGTLAASLDDNGLMQVWSVSDGTVLWQTTLADSGYFVMRFSDGDSRITVISENGTITSYGAGE